MTTRRSLAWSGAKAGSITAAAICLILGVGVAIISVLFTPLAAGWVPRIIFGFALYALIAAVLGALVGAVAGVLQKPVVGGYFGAVTFAVFSGVPATLAMLSRDPAPEFIGSVIYSSSVGGAAGALGGLTGKRWSTATEKRMPVQISVREVLLLLLLLVIPFAWIGHERPRSKASTIIREFGGHVSWVAKVDSLALWSVKFNDPNFGNDKLGSIAHHLSRYPKLHVDLTGSGVENAGLRHLFALPNLVRVTVSHTGVTQEGISEIRQELPNCEIVR